MATFVIAKDGTRLMPTTNIKKVRTLLKKKRAVVYCYDPFTIQLTYEGTKHVQPMELTQDAGYQHIGVSVKSEKHEYVSEQYDLLPDEPERHNDRRKYRRSRRSRKRYRKPRFDNRAIPKGWLPPSLEHKEQLHVQIFDKYNAVAPISQVVVEVAQFDTQLLEAIEAGKPLPEGKDYQRGEQYGYDTLREAVFSRDKYTCLCCGRNAFKDGAILRMHHIGFQTGDRSNRMGNLASVCTKCHTARNHKPGGKLYGWKPKLTGFKGAAFMNAVKFQICEALRMKHPDVAVTFGARTKRARLYRQLAKSHTNDAYCIGSYRPRHRSRPTVYAKRRRNNRCLEKFYDAKYVDTRDETVKSGAQLSCGRTNRSTPRSNPLNERIYRGEKKSKGRRSIRRRRYSLRPYDIVQVNGRRCTVKGVQNKGAYVALSDGTVVSIAKVKAIRHIGGWSKETTKPA